MDDVVLVGANDALRPGIEVARLERRDAVLVGLDGVAGLDREKAIDVVVADLTGGEGTDDLAAALLVGLVPDLHHGLIGAGPGLRGAAADGLDGLYAPGADVQQHLERDAALDAAAGEQDGQIGPGVVEIGKDVVGVRQATEHLAVQLLQLDRVEHGLRILAAVGAGGDIAHFLGRLGLGIVARILGHVLHFAGVVLHQLGADAAKGDQVVDARLETGLLDLQAMVHHGQDALADDGQAIVVGGAGRLHEQRAGGAPRVERGTEVPVRQVAVLLDVGRDAAARPDVAVAVVIGQAPENVLHLFESPRCLEKELVDGPFGPGQDLVPDLAGVDLGVHDVRHVDVAELVDLDEEVVVAIALLEFLPGVAVQRPSGQVARALLLDEQAHQQRAHGGNIPAGGRGGRRIGNGAEQLADLEGAVVAEHRQLRKIDLGVGIREEIRHVALFGAPVEFVREHGDAEPIRVGLAPDEVHERIESVPVFFQEAGELLGDDGSVVGGVGRRVDRGRHLHVDQLRNLVVRAEPAAGAVVDRRAQLQEIDVGDVAQAHLLELLRIVGRAAVDLALDAEAALGVAEIGFHQALVDVARGLDRGDAVGYRGPGLRDGEEFLLGLIFQRHLFAPSGPSIHRHSRQRAWRPRRRAKSGERQPCTACTRARCGRTAYCAPPYSGRSRI